MFKTTRLLALILALVMVFALALTGCNKGGSTDDDDDTKASHPILRARLSPQTL